MLKCKKCGKEVIKEKEEYKKTCSCDAAIVAEMVVKLKGKGKLS